MTRRALGAIPRCVGPRLTAHSVLVAALAALMLGAFPLTARASLSWSAPAAVAQSGAQVLKGIACPSAAQCTAVDNVGREATFNPASPGTPTMTSVDPGAN